MIDAKRLAEMMTPEKMRELADFIDTLEVGSHEQPFFRTMHLDKRDCAAAVLREVAGRGEKPLRCGVEGCESEAQTAPLCGKHLKDFTPDVDADMIRDGIAQAFAEMPDQIYNAISEAVFSHLQKHGVQCPKAKG